VHAVLGLDLERGGDVGRRGDDLRGEDGRRGLHAAAAHLLAERREPHLEVHALRGDERAAAVLADEDALGDERVDGLPDGHAGQAELLAEGTLGGDGVADAELLRDERDEVVADDEVLVRRCGVLVRGLLHRAVHSFVRCRASRAGRAGRAGRRPGVGRRPRTPWL
jgi:hypothetical protein